MNADRKSSQWPVSGRKSALECGDSSPLSALADLLASKGVCSGRLSVRRGRSGTFDGDKSPRQSGDKSPHSTAAPCSASAFTLIEMLVVIAIIGLLAALLMNLLPRASNMKIRTRVKAELAQVDMAIETYKEKRGYYPPDNPSNPGSNSLYYELVGTTFDGTSKFSPLNGDQ